MAGTFSQIYIQYVFAVKGRENLLQKPWRDEVFKGMNLRNVNRVLVELGIVQPGNDGKASQSLALPGVPKGRAYVVDATKLFADEPTGLMAAA